MGVLKGAVGLSERDNWRGAESKLLSGVSVALEVIQPIAVSVDLLVVDFQDSSEPVHGVHQLR